MIRVDSRLSRLGARLVYAVLEPVVVKPSGPALLAEISRVESEIRERYGALDRLREDPRVRALRSFLWRLGIDPTKTRPSSEALVRRILRGGRLPRINNIVDAGNAVSASTLVPIGLYDLDEVEPPLELRLCEDECVFEPIGGSVERLRRGTPVLVDSTGLVMHVYPHRDSRATMIKEGTKRVLAVAAGVEAFSWSELASAIERIVGLLRLDGLSVEITEGPSRAE